MISSDCYTTHSFFVSFSVFFFPVNKHKPWIETSYHGVITENTDVVLLDPPLVALDKDAPVPYAGEAAYTCVYIQGRGEVKVTAWSDFQCHINPCRQRKTQETHTVLEELV